MSIVQRLSRMRRALPRAAVSAAVFGTAVVNDTAAQKWPEKPVRIVVPFVPGGGADVVGRILGQRLTEALGQQSIIENRGGAGSTIGNEFVAKAAADGYTLLIASAAFTFIPSPYPKLGYDSLKCRDKTPYER